jgi:hypothetical protein
MFSHDGTRLAVGGGSWYGDGGILLLSLSSGQTELFPCVDLPSPDQHWSAPTVSGVCFSADDRHLAASAWSSGHSIGPTLLFEVSGVRLTHQATLEHPSQDHFRGPCPTGVLFTGSYTITRKYDADVPDVIAVWKTPGRLNVSTDSAPHHLTSSRLVVVRGSVITGPGPGFSPSPWGQTPERPRTSPRRTAARLPLSE